jgi:hypothetical protein
MFAGDATVAIRDSTISGNSASSKLILSRPPTGGRMISGNSSTTIYNSTIAFNYGTKVGGLSLGPGGTSSIIANNVKGTGMSASDLYQIPSTPTTMTGHSNLVMDSSFTLLIGFNVTSADPQLGPLQDNGGPTLTHSLVPGSPAVPAGNIKAGSILISDQLDNPAAPAGARPISAHLNSMRFFGTTSSRFGLHKESAPLVCRSIGAGQLFHEDCP